MLYQVFRSILSGSPVNFPSVVMQILAVLFIIFCILPLHEFAHGWMAEKLGDSTARYNGRLTMNPLASIDPLGALAILLFGFGWAKPVPVNPRNFRNPKGDMAITALAGPVSNLLAALVGALLYNLFYLVLRPFLPDVLLLLLGFFFQYYIGINVMLAVFNLIPLPPLDGSRILGAFLSDRALFKYYQNQRVIMIVLFALLFMGVLDVPLGILQMGAQSAISWLAALPFKLFGF
jgi:Zn-dependent protease